MYRKLEGKTQTSQTKEQASSGLCECACGTEQSKTMDAQPAGNKAATNLRNDFERNQ